MSNISEALSAIVKGKKKLGQKITQVELAKILGCSQGQLSGMLRGDKPIKADRLEKFCVALEIKLSDLENWNPELAEIRLSQGSGKVTPPELAKARAKLDKLYHSDRKGFNVISAAIDASLKPTDKAQPEAELEKKVVA